MTPRRPLEVPSLECLNPVPQARSVRSLGVLVGPAMFLHLSLLLALVGPLGSRLGTRPNLLPPTSEARCKPSWLTGLLLNIAAMSKVSRTMIAARCVGFKLLRGSGICTGSVHGRNRSGTNISRPLKLPVDSSDGLPASSMPVSFPAQNVFGA